MAARLETTLNLCILMDSPFHIIDTIRMGQLNKHCKGSYIFFLNYDVFLSLNGVLI